ncbi:NUMOD1 domain-containing DNA-binding protein [Bacillus mycoides]|uniref:NUMOD1 domain-containing DNA-binding protein n=1 Tax=Bacillus mycoides TaxID=1405 RepID=UPI000BF57EB1|nr:NUMOD1 domain-containing DNA-binding protein [Bacillus mycoides]PGA05603.1 hypothetical protein COL71_25670 [Bacillus mycoides]
MRNVIYKATNMVNGKVYIGLTMQLFSERKKEHRKDSKKKDNPFYRAIRKYGWTSFEWEIIDKADTREELNEKEKYWIANYDSYSSKRGYNATRGGDSFEFTDETKLKMAIAKGSKSFKVFDLYGVVIGEYIKKSDFATDFGLGDGSSVSIGLKNKRLGRPVKYFAIYDDEFSNEVLDELIAQFGMREMRHLVDDEIELIKNGFKRKYCLDKLSKKHRVTMGVLMSLEQEYMKEKETELKRKEEERKKAKMERAKARRKLSDEDIKNVELMLQEGCLKVEIARKYDINIGTLERYISSMDIVLSKSIDIQERKAIYLGQKPFLVYDLNGNFIKEYVVKSECARDLGLNVETMHRTMTKGKKHKGYILIYKEDFSEELLRSLVEDKRAKSTNKLTEDDVCEIKKKIMKGCSNKELSDEYGVSSNSIHRIKIGEAWSDIYIEGWIPVEAKTNNNGFKPRLSSYDIWTIQIMIDEGRKLVDIAKEFGVHVNTISRIKNRGNKPKTDSA